MLNTLFLFVYVVKSRDNEVRLPHKFAVGNEVAYKIIVYSNSTIILPIIDNVVREKK